MTFPRIHLNGSSPESLLDGLLTVRSALTNALDALAENAPNARDYYPLGALAFQAAAVEHADRLARLTSVQREITALADHVMNEITTREKRK